MSGSSRREEIREIHKKYRFFYEMLAGAAVLLLCVLFGAGAFGGENIDYRMNLFTEGMGIVATVFIINRWYAHRERTSLQRRLIREAGSRSHDIAISAVEWMDREGWLSGEDGLLKGADLGGAKLAEARLESANLEGAILDFALLSKVNMSGARLARASLIDADLENALLKDTDLHGATMRFANLQGAGLPGANMEKISAVKADLSNTNLLNVALRDADLKLASLQGAFLMDTDFTGANLLGANLADVEEANQAIWERANLARVDLSITDLEKANMKGAILRYADLRSANLVGTDLENADFYGAYLQDAQIRYWRVETENWLQDVSGSQETENTTRVFRVTNFVGARLPDGTNFTEDMDVFEIQRFVNPSDSRFAATLKIIERIRAL